MMTLSKFAKIAHVSVATASKAFSGSSEVNEQTREMIFDIAKKEGCFKKFFNAKYRKFVIAIICPEFSSLHYADYLSLIQKNLEKENCEICVATTSFSAQTERDLMEYYYQYANVDGIIVINSQVKHTDNYEIPVIFINSIYEQPGYVSISNDTLSAFSESIEYLVRHHVDSIGFIGENLTIGKLRQFRKVLAEKGLEPNENDISITAERFEAGGYAAMEALFSRNQLPRAIVCAYDYMAIGAIRCIYDHGKTVPDDIAVLGMDDIPEARYLNPPLASLSSQIEELCRIASSAIVRQINGEAAEYTHTVNSDFCLRKSFEIS